MLYVLTHGIQTFVRTEALQNEEVFGNICRVGALVALVRSWKRLINGTIPDYLGPRKAFVNDVIRYIYSHKVPIRIANCAIVIVFGVQWVSSALRVEMISSNANFGSIGVR